MEGGASSQKAPTAAAASTQHAAAAPAVESHSRQAGIPAPGKFLTTPAVRKIAKEHRLDLALVRASGPKGRIVKEDVLAFIAGKQTQQQQPASSSSAHTSAAAATGSSASAAGAAKAASQKGDQRVPIRGIQRLMVKSMTDSLQVRRTHLHYVFHFPRANAPLVVTIHCTG